MRNFKILILAVLAVFLINVSGSGAFSLKEKVGGLSIEKDKKKSSFDIGKNTKKFKESLFGSLELMLESIIAINKAIGLKEEAINKLEAGLNELREAKEKDDFEAFKKIYSQNEEAIKELNEKLKSVDLAKEAKAKGARKHMGVAFLDTGVAVYLDKKAVDYGKELVEKLPDEISSNPVKAAELKSVLDTAMFAVSNVPGQLISFGTIVNKVGQYASVNGLKVSAEEQEKVVKELAPTAYEDFRAEDLLG